MAVEQPFGSILKKKKELSITKIHRGEIPELVFREGVYWLHKAVHVLGACESHVNTGRPTWSLSESYQCSYFGARAILAFLGVAITEVENESFLFDICRDLAGLRQNTVNELGAFDEEVRIIVIGGYLFDHRQMWSIFRRVVRVTTRLNWPTDWQTYFANIDIPSLTKQRHSLHYRVDYWTMNDMHEFLHDDHFCDIKPTSNGRALFDAEKNNYSLSVACTTTNIALILFAEISNNSSRLANEHALLSRSLSPERHPCFSNGLRERLSERVGGPRGRTSLSY